MLTMVTFHKKRKAQSEYMKYLKHIVSIQLLSKVCEASNEFPPQSFSWEAYVILQEAVGVFPDDSKSKLLLPESLSQMFSMPLYFESFHLNFKFQE